MLGCWADGREARRSWEPMERVRSLCEGAHGIRTGEQQPVEMSACDNGVQLTKGRRRRYLNGWDKKWDGTESLQLRGECRGLRSRSRDEDATALERVFHLYDIVRSGFLAGHFRR